MPKTMTLLLPLTCVALAASLAASGRQLPADSPASDPKRSTPAMMDLQLPAQDPTQERTYPGVRLTYELPVDALQRQLQQEPGQDLEQTLANIVRTMQTRLGEFGTVTRHGTTGFRIDVPAASPAAIARIERRIAAPGRLEMSIVADRAYRDADLQLDAERQHLQAWLDDGNLDRVRAEPRWVAQLPRRPGSQVRWVPHIVRPVRRVAGMRWGRSLAQATGFQDVVVPLYRDADWNGGVPPNPQQSDDAKLVELVPLNLHAASFSDRDLDNEAVSLTNGLRGRPAVHYAITREREGDYSDWTHRFTGSAVGTVLDGVLLSAPTLRSRIRRFGIIDGGFTKAQAEDMVATLRSKRLTVRPKLVAKIELPR